MRFTPIVLHRHNKCKDGDPFALFSNNKYIFCGTVNIYARLQELTLISNRSMASYFDEHNCQPLATGETPDHMMHIARLLVDTGHWNDVRNHVTLF